MMIKYGLLVVAYLLGAIPFGFVIGKIKGVDIREHGSKNIGTTNTGRVLGNKYAIITYVLDTFKGFIIVFLFRFNIIPSEYCFLSPMIYGLFAILGHTFSIYLKFKGGKAVATSGGVILGYCPWLLLIALIIFFLVTYLSSYVSLGSLISASFVTIIVVIMTFIGYDYILAKDIDIYFAIVSLISLSVIYFRHLSNIKRLYHHQEAKIKWGRKNSQ
ncbi:MAG TPA: glycerol-3-phosphate 1-O-acyltransferase PlsY [Bacilli bacterium]|nr:glycerol-3-phosphate 1-O-acyltransferase PlsY [Bacilli bacterium]